MQPDEKLTKRCFFGLPEGKYLVSNTHHAPGIPIFAEYVTPPEKREAQWRRIVAARVGGRHFSMFETCDGYAQMLKMLGLATNLN